MPVDLDSPSHLSVSRRLISLFCLPLLLAAALGLLVGLDPLLGYLYPVGLFEYPINLTIPYFLTAIVLGLLLLGYSLIRFHESIFSKRYHIVVLLVVVGAASGGLNIGPLDPTDFAFLMATLFWVAVSLIEGCPIVAPLPVILMLLGLTACAIGSAVNGQAVTIILLNRILTKIILVFVVINIVSTRSLLRFALRAFVAVAVISAVVGIVSELLYIFMDYRFTADELSASQTKDTPFGVMLRVTAFQPTSQNLAHLLLLGASILLFMPLGPAKRLVGLALIIACIGCTFNTGGYVTMAVILVLYFFIRRPSRSPHYLACLLAVALLGYVTGVWHLLYEHVISPLGGRGLEDRVDYIRVGLDAIDRHPVLGIGFGCIGRVLHTAIHNTYLQFAAEIGIPAGVIVVALVLYGIIGTARSAARATSREAKAWLKGLSLGMVALSVHTLTEPVHLLVVFWLFIALTASAIVVYGDDPHSPRSEPRPAESVSEA